MWCIYAMKYYSVIKNKERMPFPATQRDLEIVTLGEVSQTERDTYDMISLICGTVLYTSSLTRQLKNLRDE